MTISGNLGIGMEGNVVGADPKQKRNMNLHNIIVTIPVFAKENISSF